MHRSTRPRRLAVAFLVVLVIAVAVRFARASSARGPGESRDPGAATYTAPGLGS